MSNYLKKLDELRALLTARYGGAWKDLPPGERVLQGMAILADRVKVRETPKNRGEWVEAFLASTGLGGGHPWCAASLTFVCKAVEAPHPKTGGASVWSWRKWARETGRSRTQPKRGYACERNFGGGKGHIGIVIRVVGPFVYSLEGNTGPGEEGSQRDGDGLYRRVRTKKFWTGYIDLDNS